MSLEKMKHKTLLFSNGDYHIQEPVTVKEIKKKTVEELEEIFYSRHGRNNTGTFLMTDSLINILDCQKIPSNYNFSNTNADAVVTIAFHFIGPRYVVAKEYWKKILKSDIKVVPMSLGFLTKDAANHLDKDLKALLSEIAERNEIGCRTEFDAEALVQNGIKNVCVIGCPSLYYGMDRSFTVNNIKKEKVQSVNFNYNALDPSHPSYGSYINTFLPIMWYFQDLFYNYRKDIHIDYTMQDPYTNEIFSRLWISQKAEYDEFYNECGRYFFSVEDWINGVKQNDFSIGTRFHGNVAAILAGVPALMINTDARIRGFTSYYKIPSIEIRDFDPSKPIEYYYELADYTEFNKNYAKTYDNFVDYCRKNDVELKIDKEAGNG